MADKRNYLYLLSKIIGDLKIGVKNPKLEILSYMFTQQIKENFIPSCENQMDIAILNKVVYFCTCD